MRTEAILTAIMMFVTWLILIANPAVAIKAGDLQNLRIDGHYFTTGILTIYNRISTSNPSAGRYIVLKLTANVVENSVDVFAPDFVLVYTHPDGREDRAECDAIGESDTENPDEFERFYAGNVPRISLRKGIAHFGLAFWIESDVEYVELHCIGGKKLSYTIGKKRPWSVFITTNNSYDVSSIAEDLVKQGNYQVVCKSEGLDSKVTGVTVHYMSEAEAQAREISKRLSTKLGIVPNIKQTSLVSETDIVIWLGK